MKETTLKVFSVVMSILLFLSVAFGVLMYYTDWGRDWSKFTSDSEEMSADGGLIIGEESGSISLMSAVIPKEEYEANGVPANAEMAYTVTATVTPSNDATNTGVAWSGQWVNASSAWASGKTLSDYVTATPSGDGYMESKTAVIACLQAFGEPVMMTVTCTDAPDKTSSFQLDYAAQPTGIELSFGDVECNIGGDTGVVVEINSYADISTVQGGKPNLTILTDDVYTVSPEFEVSYSLTGKKFMSYTASGYGVEGWYIFGTWLPSPDFKDEYADLSGYSVAEKGLYFGFKYMSDNLQLHTVGGGMGSLTARPASEHIPSEFIQRFTHAGESLIPEGESLTYTYGNDLEMLDLTVTLSNSYFNGSYSTTFYISGYTNTAVISNVSTDASDGILFVAD